MLVSLFAIQKGWRWTGEDSKQNRGMLQELVRGWTCSAWRKGSGDLICVSQYLMSVCKGVGRSSFTRNHAQKNGEMGTRGTGGDSSWSQEDNFVTMVTCRRCNNSPGTWWKLILENVRFGYTKCWMLCYGMCFYHNRLDQLTSEVPSNLSFDFSYL